MKIRKSFVTNSSSSSYLCVYKINGTNDEIKENFGKFGEIIIKDYAYTDINDMIDYIIQNEYIDDYIQNEICDICEKDEDKCSSCMIDLSDEIKKKYITEHYFQPEENTIYLVGYSYIGYGGEADCKDDSTVMLGELLVNENLATKVYKGEY